MYGLVDVEAHLKREGKKTLSQTTETHTTTTFTSEESEQQKMLSKIEAQMQNKERRKTLVRVGEIRPGETSITISGRDDSLAAIKAKALQRKKTSNQSISVKGYKAMTKWKRRMTLVSTSRGEPLVSMENRRHSLQVPSDDESNHKPPGNSNGLNFKSLRPSELQSSSDSSSPESRPSATDQKAK